MTEIVIDKKNMCGAGKRLQSTTKESCTKNKTRKIIEC
jgi:hypothetical protein